MDPILATIILWPGSWIPQGWLACNGQLLSIAQYTALYSLLGTTYGGNGISNFALPNLCGRVPVGVGQLANTQSNYTLAQTGGSENITLTTPQIPQHTHTAVATLGGTIIVTLPAITATGNMAVSAAAGNTNTPSATNVPSLVPNIVNAAPVINKPVNAYGPADAVTKWPVNINVSYTGGTKLNIPMTGSTANVTIGNAGGGLAHENRMPFMALNYIIAVQGLYPTMP